MRTQHLILAIGLCLLGFVQSTLNTCNLPNECEIRTDDVADMDVISIRCDLVPDIYFNSVNVSYEAKNEMRKCINSRLNDVLKHTYFKFVAKPWSKFLLNPRQFNFANFLEFLNLIRLESQILKLERSGLYIVAFQYLSGLQMINRKFEITKMIIANFQFLEIMISESKFHFYLDETTRIKSCDDITDLNHIESPFVRFNYNIYGIIRYIYVLKVKKCDFNEIVCPVVFRNAKIFRFQISNLVRSYLKTNVLSFSSFNSNTSVNSDIRTLELLFVENIDLDSTFLNQHVFENIQR
jgi:hypothetical protein